jgi:leucyl-tRNA synthetase
VLMIAPLAPHIAEELWAKLGHPASVAYAPFPVADPALAQAAVVAVPVQVNGRTRFRIEVAAESDAAAVEAAVRAHADYARWTAGGSVERMVVVPGRIVNVILRS